MPFMLSFISLVNVEPCLQGLLLLICFTGDVVTLKIPYGGDLTASEALLFSFGSLRGSSLQSYSPFWGFGD